ncbi:MAG: ATP-dependent zinc protease [Betaproteobacteria bacterium]|nr:ATP-dependent zinc protease [Betaproteobacteria bacterium]
MDTMNSVRSVASACVALVLLLSAACAAYAAPPDAAPVAGWLERARLSPGDIVLEAKLDSGARTSSLHAVNLRQFERDGKEWVAFDVAGDNGRSVHIERPLVRIARIKSALGTDEARPTVTLGVCIGTVYRVTEVNLVDRDGLSKPLLIGRRFLKGRLLVDLNRRYLLEPTCRRKTVR